MLTWKALREAVARKTAFTKGDWEMMRGECFFPTTPPHSHTGKKENSQRDQDTGSELDVEIQRGNWSTIDHSVIYRKAVRNKHGQINTLGVPGGNRHWKRYIMYKRRGAVHSGLQQPIIYTAHNKIRIVLLYVPWFLILQTWEWFRFSHLSLSKRAKNCISKK